MCTSTKRISVRLFALLIVLSITPQKANEVKVKVLKEAPARSQAFSQKEIQNIVEASRLSGVSPAWIAGMTKAESGGNCLSRAFNGPKIIKWGVPRKFGEDLGALKRAGVTKRTIYSDHKGGDNSYFHRAYKIAPKTAVYVTAWGTNQVMGWELLRLGGLSTKIPGGNPDAIVSKFFNDPCGMSSLLLASWVNNSGGSWFRGVANRAAKTGSFKDYRRTTTKFLGAFSENYNSRVMRYSKIFREQNPRIVSQFESGELLAGKPMAAGPSQPPPPGAPGAKRKLARGDLEGKTIILMGDSQMIGTSEVPGTNWTSKHIGPKLAGILTERGAKVITIAVGGTGARYWNRVLAGQDPNKVKKYSVEYLKKLKPAKIIMSLGTNDSRQGNYGQDEKKMKEFFEKEALPLMKNLKSITPNVQWFGPEQRSEASRKGPGHREKLKRGHILVDLILNDIAKQAGVTYVSMLAWSKTDERLKGLKPREIRYDGVHIKGDMAQYYAETMAKEIAGAPPGVATAPPAPASPRAPVINKRYVIIAGNSHAGGTFSRIRAEYKKLEKQTGIDYIIKRIDSPQGRGGEIKTQLSRIKKLANVLRTRGAYVAAVIHTGTVLNGSPPAGGKPGTGDYERIKGLINEYISLTKNVIFIGSPASRTDYEGHGDRVKWNEWLKENLPKYGVKYVETAGVTGDKDLSDHVHLSRKGYNKMMSAAIPSITFDAGASASTPGSSSATTLPQKTAATKGVFVHGISPIEKFKFDVFYEELDIYFPDKKVEGMLPKHGKDYKFGREHQVAYQKLQKAKQLRASAAQTPSTPSSPTSKPPPTVGAKLPKVSKCPEGTVQRGKKCYRTEISVPVPANLAEAHLLENKTKLIIEIKKRKQIQLFNI